jgi:hypothetical protein
VIRGSIGGKQSSHCFFRNERNEVATRRAVLRDTITNFNPNFPLAGLPPVFRVNSVSGMQDQVVGWAVSSIRPSGLAFDANGDLFVPDLATQQIHSVDLDTGVLGQSLAPGEYFNPIDMIGTATGLLVADNTSGQGAGGSIHDTPDRAVQAGAAGGEVAGVQAHLASETNPAGDR